MKGFYRQLRHKWPNHCPSERSVMRWLNGQFNVLPPPKRGRPLIPGLDEAVINQLYGAQSLHGNLVLVWNLTFSRADFQRAAQTAREYLLRFCDETMRKKLGKIQFSLGWVQKFLQRHMLARRCATSTTPVSPATTEEIEKALVNAQRLRRCSTKPIFWVNMDESAVVFTQGPSHVFVPRAFDGRTDLGVTEVDDDKVP